MHFLNAMEDFDAQISSQVPLPHSTTRSNSFPERREEGRQEPATEDAARGEVQLFAAATGGGRQIETEAKLSPPATTEADSSAEGAEESRHGGPSGVTYVPYESELQLPHIMRLMKADLSEPYSIYTYRYFIHNWPNLCFLVCLEGWIDRHCQHVCILLYRESQHRYYNSGATISMML